MSSTKDILVNGRTYKVRLLPPLEAFQFYEAWCNRTDSTEENSAFGKAALRRCLTASGESLLTDADLNKYFLKHPEDMIPLSNFALVALLQDFQGGLNKYLEDSRLLVRQMRFKPKSLKVPAGWECESFFGRLVNSGLCRHGELKNGDITNSDVFAMFRLLDWKEYCASVVLERAELNKPKKR